MPAKITAGDAYHKLKLRWPDCLLAFGVGFMIEFVRSDAREVARLLQEPIDNPAGYDSVVIHSGKFFTAVRRLNLMGKSVALFSRQTTPKGRRVFVFERRFDPIVPGNSQCAYLCRRSVLSVTCGVQRYGRTPDT